MACELHINKTVFKKTRGEDENEILKILDESKRSQKKNKGKRT